MIGGEKMTKGHWALFERLQELFKVVKFTDVQSMDDIAEQFGAYRVPDTHPHAPEEFTHAHILNVEVPSNFAPPGDHEVPLRYTVVKHGPLTGSGFMRILPPGASEWTGFSSLTQGHLHCLEGSLIPWFESYPQADEKIAARHLKERADQAVAQLIEALHSRDEFIEAEVDLLETLAQVFYMRDVPGLTPQGSAYAKALHTSALETAKLVLDRLK